MGWKHTAYHINKSDPGRNPLKQQLDKNLKITLVSSSKNTVEKKKEDNDNCQAFCVSCKRRKKKKQEVGDDLSVCMLNLFP